MTETWFYERTEDGWEIRDENRLLVAIVPDVQHEREADARLIARAASLDGRQPESPQGERLSIPVNLPVSNHAPRNVPSLTSAVE